MQSLCILLIGILLGFAAAQSSSTPPSWQSGVAYTVGELVVENNAVYKCLQAHTSQIDWDPSGTPALWQATGATIAPTDKLALAGSSSAASSCWPAWSSSTEYVGGAQVSYDGNNYRAEWWTQGDVPPENTGVGLPWVLVGSCVGSQASAAASSSSSSADQVPTIASTTVPVTTAPSAASSGADASSSATFIPAVSTSGGCGWHGKGTPLQVAPNIEICLPPVVCNSETCPPPLGTCVDGACQFKNGYKGLQTEPQGWSTYYCTLSTGGCHGVTQIVFPEVTAAEVAAALSRPICESYSGNDTCIGIAASSPMVVGNSQLAVDPSTGEEVTNWGLGFTEASGLCYQITGPGGTAIVALTDRCGGYCKCGGSGYEECGPCVNAADMQPNCPCVGTVPGLFDECCGLGCPTTEQECDWCASNNHPHFDLDTGTYAHVCGDEASRGSCQLSEITYVSCLTPNSAWPPGSKGGDANDEASCPTNQFNCSGVAPSAEQPVVPGTSCCCSWGMTPQSDGSCQ